MAKKGTTMDPNDLGQDGSNSAATLLSAIENIQSLEEEKADAQTRIKEEYAAVKATGFDVKIASRVSRRMAFPSSARSADNPARRSHEVTFSIKG